MLNKKKAIAQRVETEGLNHDDDDDNNNETWNL